MSARNSGVINLQVENKTWEWSGYIFVQEEMDGC